jgi:DNA-binding HxlR family transcriptional regulator
MSAPIPKPGRTAVAPARRGKAKHADGCEIGDLFRLLGRSHVLGLLYTINTSEGPRRFVDLQKELAISPNTLSERLKDLVAAGLLTRTAYNEIPPRVDYAATQKARDLMPVFESLGTWAQRNDLQPAPEPQPPAKASA